MFITFEGIDGCGKSTQAKKLADWLKDNNRPVLLTREPGGWDGGNILRNMVLSGSLKHPWSELYLFMLDRAEHIAAVIRPALDFGSNVICERYHDSTIAYQVWGRGLPQDRINSLAKASDFPVPDCTVFFDLPVETAVQRIAKRGGLDSFEQEGLVFMSKIREGYKNLAQREPNRWLVIDCSFKSEDEIFLTLLDSLIKRGILIA